MHLGRNELGYLIGGLYSVFGKVTDCISGVLWLSWNCFGAFILPFLDFFFLLSLIYWHLGLCILLISPFCSIASLHHLLDFVSWAISFLLPDFSEIISFLMIPTYLYSAIGHLATIKISPFFLFIILLDRESIRTINLSFSISSQEPSTSLHTHFSTFSQPI